MSRTIWIESVDIENEMRSRFDQMTTVVTVKIRSTDPEFVRRLLARFEAEFERETTSGPALTSGAPALPPAPIEGVFEDE